MDYIIDILEKENPTIEELISCFEQVKDDGNVAAIKFDGARETCHYTVFISFPGNHAREIIRTDQADLKSALYTVLRKYISI